MALRAYRAFLRVAAGMPGAQRAAAVAEARAGLEFHRDAAQPASLIEDFESRVAFLKMTTPKRRQAAQGGRTRVVYRGGERVEVGTEWSRAAYSNWDGANMDPDSVARHNHQLGRMGFRDNAHAKGFF
mmetsp:Transcript_16183/g.48284  ORF Transcript_16183/g.48284 Transcript_16183/m.48284 type:complete len:128 (-) Transcript_16183:45-428(-)